MNYISPSITCIIEELHRINRLLNSKINKRTLKTINGEALVAENAGNIVLNGVTSSSPNVKVKKVTSNYTVQAEDDIILVDTTVGNINITLPSAVGLVDVDGRTKTITIKKITTANTMNVLTTGGQTIDNVSSPSSLANLSSIVLVSGNFNFFII